MAKETDKLILSAQKLAQRGQLDKALKEYLKVLEIDKKDVKTHLKVGDLYSKLKNKESAIKHYLEAAKYYTKDGFYPKAIAVYKQILTLDENRDDVYLQIADLNQRMGMMGDAMACYQRVASNYEKDGKLKEALDIYRRMAELDPKNVTNLTKLAEIYYKSGMKKEGYQAFRRALEELKAQNRFEDYVRLMEKLAKAEPDNLENLKELCQVYIKRKAYDRAYPALARIYQNTPDDLQNLTNLAQVCVKLERKEEAINLFKELARGYQKQGLKSKAKEALQKVLELDPNDALAQKVLATIGTEPVALKVEKAEEEVVELSEPAVEEEAEIEELEEAIEEEAVVVEEPPPKMIEEKLTPEQIRDHLTEADVYLKYGLRDKALTHVQTVLKTDPENIEAFKRLKKIELDARNQTAALETLRKIGFLAEKKEDWKSLLESAREILQLKPDDKNAEIWLKKADQELEKKKAVPEAPKPEVAPEPEIIEAEEEVVEVEEQEEIKPAPEPIATKPEEKQVPAEIKEPPIQAPPKKEIAAPPQPEPVSALKEELEEAEFYIQQGLNEEALRVYLEILKKDPKNKQVLAKVKELEEIIKAKEEKIEVEEEEIEVKLETKPAEVEVKAEIEKPVPVEKEVKEEEIEVKLETKPAEVEVKAEIEKPVPVEKEVKEEEIEVKLETKPAEIEVKAEAEEKEVLVEEELAEEGEVLEEEEIQAEVESKAPEALETIPAQAQEAPEVEREEVVEEEVEVSIGAKEEVGVEASVEEPVSEEPAPTEVAPAPPISAKEPTVEEEVIPGVEAPPEAPSAEAVAGSELFASEGEEGLFDLAAELEKEDLGPAPQVSGLSTSEKYSFEDMFKSFKDGVSKVVSEDDAATHYDLGIAYKEMGLYDDAENEFRIALKAGYNMVDCHLMIGLCHSERGRFEKAIEEYEAGIAVPNITEKEKTALFYELAQAWLGLGDLNKALRMFEKTQSLDPGFRDVGVKIEELKARLAGVKPEVPEVPSREEVSWESAALTEPAVEAEAKPEEVKTEEDKKKKTKKISYV